MRCESVRWSSAVLDCFCAPKLSLLTESNAPRLTVNRRDFVLNFVLNSVMKVRFNDKQYAYLYNFLRRTQHALDEYAIAQEKLEHYVRLRESQALSVYLESLYHFEMFLCQSAQASELLESLFNEESKAGARGGIKKEARVAIRTIRTQFKKLRVFYEFCKHTNQQIFHGSFPENGSVVLWITNEGLEIFRRRPQDNNECIEKLNWTKIEGILKDLIESAELIERWPHDEAMRVHSESS